MGSLYRSQHELVFVFKHGKTQHRNNVQLGRQAATAPMSGSYPRVNSASAALARRATCWRCIPTVKPVALVADAILDCSARGDIVLDPFLGSRHHADGGASAPAGAATGSELDPLYVDTIVRRWQAYTGGSAMHAVTGRCFDETAAMRIFRRGGVPWRVVDKGNPRLRGRPRQAAHPLAIQARSKRQPPRSPAGVARTWRPCLRMNWSRRSSSTENGREVTVTKSELAVKQAVNSWLLATRAST